MEYIDCPVPLITLKHCAVPIKHEQREHIINELYGYQLQMYSNKANS